MAIHPLGSAMENPALHNVPKPWVSDSKQYITVGLILIFVFIVGGIFVSVALGEFGCCFFFLFIAFFIGIIAYQKANDNKDDWYWQFRYNEKQFHQIGRELQEYLAFTKVGFYGGNKPKTRFLAKIPHWEFTVSTKPPLTISLNVVDAGSNGRFTKILVNNITMYNLDDARNIVDVISHIAREAGKRRY